MGLALRKPIETMEPVFGNIPQLGSFGDQQQAPFTVSVNHTMESFSVREDKAVFKKKKRRGT